MSFVGDYVGQWVGEWLGQALNPGAMYANIGGSGDISAEIDFVAEDATRPSGGFTYPLDALRSQRHVPKTAKAIIKRLAKKQVEEQIDDVETAESQAFVQQLMTALAKADLQYQAFYAEILEQERQRLIDEEIKYLMGLKRMRDEEEEVLAVLMAIP